MRDPQGFLFRGGILAEDFAPVELARSVSAGGGRSYPEDCSALAFARMECMRLRARGAVKAALKTGKLTRPSACESCGGTERIESHHSDYALPLAVQWLCDSCHTAETKRLADLARASLPTAHKSLSVAWPKLEPSLTTCSECGSIYQTALGACPTPQYHQVYAENEKD